jgi:hypothetical protein
MLSGALFVAAAAALWWALATWREGTTYHLAPVVVTAAWAVVDRLQRQQRLTHIQAIMRLAAGTIATLAVTVVLETTGRLDGPALVGGTALAETLLVTAVAIPWTWWAVTWTGRHS